MLAAQAGVMRHVENLVKNKKPTYGANPERDWQMHVEGCLVEYAMSHVLGVPWHGKGKTGDIDAGDADVRSSPKDWADLILHPGDADDRPFYLVTGMNGKYRVHGWILARDGKRPEWWKDPAGGRPAFFVPQTSLHKSPHKV